nr:MULTISPECIES: LysR family transcriptional regulator [unclassified Pseudomonas]
MEALFWIAETGSFEAAANHLNMSQSAISKRIQELEDTFEVQLFDRSKRNARLTEKGAELLDCTRELLERRDVLLERISSQNVLVRRLRLGVTELTALTWLPAFIDAIRQAYPKVQIEPTVELSSELLRKLEGDQLDVIVMPDVLDDVRFVSVPLQSVDNTWMCAPGMLPADRTVDLTELAQVTVLTQGASSGTGLIYERWLALHDIQLPRTLTSHNLLVQVGLTISGIGVSYLPQNCLSHLTGRGVLQVVRTLPELPPIQYAAIYRADRRHGINPHIVELASQHCDFARLLMAMG